MAKTWVEASKGYSVVDLGQESPGSHLDLGSCNSQKPPCVA